MDSRFTEWGAVVFMALMVGPLTVASFIGVSSDTYNEILHVQSIVVLALFAAGIPISTFCGIWKLSTKVAQFSDERFSLVIVTWALGWLCVAVVAGVLVAIQNLPLAKACFIGGAAIAVTLPVTSLYLKAKFSQKTDSA